MELGSAFMVVAVTAMTLFQILVLLLVLGVWLFVFDGWDWVQKNLLAVDFAPDPPRQSITAATTDALAAAAAARPKHVEQENKKRQ